MNRQQNIKFRYISQRVMFIMKEDTFKILVFLFLFFRIVTNLK
jgi:hypothetical protein